MNNRNTTAHTTWNCKYHIVFAPKFRRKVFYGERRLEIGKILRRLCEWKGIEIEEAEVCVDHVHMLLSIPPKYSPSSIVGYLKGKSSLMINEKFPELQKKIPKPCVLVSRILCGHDWKEYAKKSRRILKIN